MQIHIRFLNSHQSVDISETSCEEGWLNGIVQQRTGIPPQEQRLLWNGKDVGLLESLSIEEGSHANVDVLLRVCGGKGGFGQMLKSLGARSANKETTNYEACRDLSGRRLRNIHDEEKMAEWIAKAGDRQKVADEKKKKRQEDVLRGPIHTFDHHKLGSETRAIKDNVETATLEALNQPTKRKDVNPKLKPKRTKIWGEEDFSSSEESQEDESDNGQEDKEEVKTEKHSKNKVENNSGSKPKEITKEEIKEDKPIDLDSYKSAADLEQLGLDTLKAELLRRKLKCGGTLEQRALRLFGAKK